MILKNFPKEWASSKQEQQIKCGMVVTLSDLGFQRWHGLRRSPTLGFTHIETPQAQGFSSVSSKQEQRTKDS